MSAGEILSLGIGYSVAFLVLLAVFIRDAVKGGVK